VSITNAVVAVVASIPLALAGCGSNSSQTAAESSGGVAGGDFHSIVADASVAGRIYVGGHTTVSRSDDRGKTWTPVAALDNADAMGWAIEPGTMWVSGHPGLTRSVDGGVTFTRHNDGLRDTDVHAFGAAGEVLYAAGPRIGVAQSADGGTSWSTQTDAHGQAFFGRILIDPTDGQHLVAADFQYGAIASHDGGRTWVPLGTDPAAWVSSPDGLRTLYASGGPAAQRSRDGGHTWETLTIPSGATLVEATPGSLYAGVHQGESVNVWVSIDDGVTWNKP